MYIKEIIYKYVNMCNKDMIYEYTHTHTRRILGRFWNLPNMSGTQKVEVLYFMG